MRKDMVMMMMMMMMMMMVTTTVRIAAIFAIHVLALCSPSSHQTPYAPAFYNEEVDRSKRTEV